MGGIAKLMANYVGVSIPPGFKYYQVISEQKHGRAWVMNPNLCTALEELKFVGESNSEELPTEEGQYHGARLLKEGKVSTVLVNRYERSSSARRACIAIHGCSCKGCGINLVEIYGDIAEGFIQVHHLVPFSEIKQRYEVDPEKDLVPLCPNCHSVVHLQEPVLTITELQTLLKKNRKK